MNLAYQFLKIYLFILGDKCGPPPALVNKVLLEHSHVNLFTYCLWLQQQSWVVAVNCMAHKVSNIYHLALYGNILLAPALHDEATIQVSSSTWWHITWITGIVFMRIKKVLQHWRNKIILDIDRKYNVLERKLSFISFLLAANEICLLIRKYLSFLVLSWLYWKYKSLKITKGRHKK